MTTTDIIEIIGIIASTTVSIVAIVISVMTLKQNSKMIEESTRPYVVFSFWVQKKEISASIAVFPFISL